MTKPTNSSSLVIANRLFLHNGQAVELFLYAPFEIGPDEWRCDFNVIGLPPDPPLYAIGVDAMQSLTIAIDAIRIKMEPHADGLTWAFGEDVGRLGLPVFVPSHFGIAFERRLLNLISTEVTDFINAARAAADERQGK